MLALLSQIILNSLGASACAFLLIPDAYAQLIALLSAGDELGFALLLLMTFC